MTDVAGVRPLPGERALGSTLLADLARSADPPAAHPPVPFTRWTRHYVAVLGFADLLIGPAAALLVPVLTTVLGLSDVRPYLGPKGSSPLVLATAGAAWPLAVLISHGYRPRTAGAGVLGGAEVRSVLRAAVTIITTVALLSVVLDQHLLLVGTVIAAATAAASSAAVRGVCRIALHLRQRRGLDRRRLAVVGPAQAAADLTAALERDAGPGVVVTGAYLPELGAAEVELLDVPVLGDLRDATLFAPAEESVDAVVVTGAQAADPEFVRDLARSLEREDVDLLVHTGITETTSTRLEVEPSDALPLIHLEQPRFAAGPSATKRLVDLTVGATALLVSIPLWLVVALLIKIDDGGPVLFRQGRVGRDGTVFTMLKFRTMIEGADSRLEDLREGDSGAGVLFKIIDDPRITRVGRWLRRFSIDEVPQLLNVLLGSMSLIGPRPPLPREVAVYDTEVSRHLLIKPGLTGLWQVSGRSLLCWEDSVRLDLRYVDNWSLLFDLRILIRTVSAVLRRQGAY